MSRAATWLTLVLLLACRESRSGVPETGQPDVATRVGSAAQSDSGLAEAGVEYEAPRLIPAIRAQMTQLQEPGGASEGNLTSFRNGVGTMLNAMTADLQRVGVTDSGYFAELSDSVLRAMGGGPGSPPDLSPEDIKPALGQVDRLIGMYEQRMRAGAR